MQLFRPKYRVDECLKEIEKVLSSGWTGTGPQCKKFEDEWSEYTGAKYSLYLSSCTAALHIALRLLDLPKGAKVVTTPLTFVSTNAVILYENLIPVFADIDSTELSLDFRDVQNKIVREGASAVIWVHYGGRVHPGFCDFVDWATENGIQVIEDCAHAGGASYFDGTKVGSRCDTISCFSYQAVKNLPTCDSGMLCLSDEKKFNRARKLSWLGIDKDTFARTNSAQNEIYKWQYDVPELGWKYNANDIVAAIARVQLRYLEQDNAYRRRIDSWYNYYLDVFNNNKVKLMFHDECSSNHLVVIMVKNRDEVISALKANNVAPGVHYLPNMYFGPFKQFYKNGTCPNVERVSNEIISLPNHLDLTEKDIKFICEVIDVTAKN